MTTDTTAMSGAEFQKHVGRDPQRWADAIVQAYDRDGVHVAPVAERAAFFAGWLCDFAEVRVAEEVGRVTARLVPRHDD
jgi:hypothetical protein